MIIFTILIFILGLCVGSFVNVLIYRLPNELSLSGRSYCPKCKNKISWYDNIPILSFILLKGKCRYCYSPISFQYPLVELVTGVLFVVSTYNFLSTDYSLNIRTILIIIYTFWIISAFLAIFIIDLKHQIIPDQLIYSSLFVVFIFEFINHKSLFLNHLLSALVASLFFYFLHQITKGKGMGFGDVKLVFLMGLILGYPNIVLALYLAFLTGAIVGVILILAKIKKIKQPIAFGPFLSLATVVSYFWGTPILKWITALLF